MLRVSTAQKRKEQEERQKEREVRERQKAKKLLSSQAATAESLKELRRLTQEELLAEAKLTEKINLESLGILDLACLKD